MKLTQGTGRGTCLWNKIFLLNSRIIQNKVLNFVYILMKTIEEIIGNQSIDYIDNMNIQKYCFNYIESFYFRNMIFFQKKSQLS